MKHRQLQVRKVMPGRVKGVKSAGKNIEVLRNKMREDLIRKKLRFKSADHKQS